MKEVKNLSTAAFFLMALSLGQTGLKAQIKDSVAAKTDTAKVKKR